MNNFIEQVDSLEQELNGAIYSIYEKISDKNGFNLLKMGKDEYGIPVIKANIFEVKIKEFVLENYNTISKGFTIFKINSILLEHGIILMKCFDVYNKKYRLKRFDAFTTKEKATIIEQIKKDFNYE